MTFKPEYEKEVISYWQSLEEKTFSKGFLALTQLRANQCSPSKGTMVLGGVRLLF